MSEPKTEEELYYERTRQPLITIPQSPIGRVGCGVAILAWFVVITLPCIFFYFAGGGQVLLLHGDIPDADAHPFLQINLIMEPDQRGFKMTTSTIVNDTNDATCVETVVNYWLWQTDGTAENVVYCDCYMRDLSETMWDLRNTTNAECQK